MLYNFININFFHKKKKITVSEHVEAGSANHNYYNMSLCARLQVEDLIYLNLLHLSFGWEKKFQGKRGEKGLPWGILSRPPPYSNHRIQVFEMCTFNRICWTSRCITLADFDRYKHMQCLYLSFTRYIQTSLKSFPAIVKKYTDKLTSKPPSQSQWH